MDWDYKKYTQGYLDKISRVYENPITKATLEIALTLFVISFFTLVAIRPTVRTIADLQNKIKRKQEISQKFSTKISQLEEAEKNYNLLKPNFIYLNEALPEKIYFISALKKIALLAKEQSVALETGSTEGFQAIQSSNIEQTESKLNKLSYTFIASGEYQNLVNFISEIENLRRIYQLESFSFSSKDTSDQNILKLNITGYLYWYEK